MSGASASKMRRMVLTVILPGILAGGAAETPPLPAHSGAERSAQKAVRREQGSALLQIQSPDGVGGAFLTMLWKQPVILTSARSWFELSSPEVCDVGGRRFRIREVLASRERDLVILGYDPPAGGAPAPLELFENAGTLPPGSGVSACGGRAKAAGTITVRYGRVTGIGPRHLEADIPFSPGFSGGALLAADGRVIGVIGGEALPPGESGERRRGTAPIRAERIDNLTVNELAPVDMERVDAERKLFRRIGAAFDEVSGAKKPREIALLSLKYAGLCWECGEQEWSCDYFRREALRKSGRIRTLAGTLGLERQFRAERIPALLLRHAAELSCVATGGGTVRCFGCTGIGRVNLAPVRKMDSFVDSGKFLNEAAKQEFVPCRFCGGTGRRSAGTPDYCFRVPESVRELVLEQFVPLPEKFCGFTPGEEFGAFFRREKFYRKRYHLLRRYETRFGETLIFRGNHRERRVAATTLVFQFGRLTEVALLVRCRGEEARELAAGLCGGVGRELPPTVTVGPLRRAEDMPCDARGNPVEPVSYFDFTAAGEYFRSGSEPFWVVRAALEAKEGLDRVDADALLRAGAKLLPGKREERP